MCVNEDRNVSCLAPSCGYLPSKFRDLGGFRDLLFLLFLLGFSLSPDSLKVRELGARRRRRRADHIRNYFKQRTLVSQYYKIEVNTLSRQNDSGRNWSRRNRGRQTRRLSITLSFMTVSGSTQTRTYTFSESTNLWHALHALPLTFLALSVTCADTQLLRLEKHNIQSLPAHVLCPCMVTVPYIIQFFILCKIKINLIPQLHCPA